MLRLLLWIDTFSTKYNQLKKNIHKQPLFSNQKILMTKPFNPTDHFCQAISEKLLILIESSPISINKTKGYASMLKVTEQLLGFKSSVRRLSIFPTTKGYQWLSATKKAKKHSCSTRNQKIAISAINWAKTFQV
jgi:hypothetical protein